MEGVVIGILSVVLLAAVAAAFYFMRLWQKAADGGQEMPKIQTMLDEKTKQQEQLQQELSDVHKEKQHIQTQHSELTGQYAAVSEQLKAAQQAAQEAAQKLADAQNELRSKDADIAELQTSLNNEKGNAAEKIKLLQDAQESMQAQFKNVAQSILEEKSKNFSSESQKQLAPLQQNIELFRSRMEELQKQNVAERSALREHIEQMQNNASKISDDANNLTQALKGSGKTQGDWGEHMLETLLERSGLVKDETYKLQETHKTEENKNQRPDVIIYLPEDKHIIIDAKVSLSAYAQYNAAEDDTQRSAALAKHIQSVNNHIDSLCAAGYNNLSTLNSPDFVLMFMAVEPAYMLAMQEDGSLFNRAYKNNVILTSPTTLMPILRTVANIWRMEERQRNVDNIAQQGAKLYDKFVGFWEYMDKLDKALNGARDAYDKANKNLRTGRGSIVTQMEKLRDMGIDTKKELPHNIVEEAE